MVKDKDPPLTTQIGAFASGLSLILSVPSALLFAAGLGFGALARDGGFSIAHTAFITASMFALPNQVVLVDQLARNETPLAVAFAVGLAALRLLPMTVTIVPLLKGGRPRPALEALAVHFVAVTPWIESQRRLPTVLAGLRLATYLGLGLAFWATMMAGTMAGYTLAASVPAPVSATLLFLTPIYFLLSLLATARVRMDLLAVGLGCALAPVFYILTPGFDLLATGLIGGTLAFLLRGRRA
ncbi:MAG TPA: AzlC family ABC transporter permease [Hyphomicrobiaceae bacterium]|nr:AzlC family ABC transporter permease [Hyphomicrobiaceae bacterium]